MVRVLLITLGCAGFALTAAENAPKPWTNERLIAHIQSVAEKLNAEYAKEAGDKEKENAKDLDSWRELDYYAEKLRNRLFVRSRDPKLNPQKMRDLQWLARESEQRSYALRLRESAAKHLKELKVLLAEIKEQLKTSEELPRGQAFQLKALSVDGAMRPMQQVWTPPKGAEVDDDKPEPKK